MKKVLLTHTSLNSFIIQPESYGATVDEGFIVGGPVGDFELLLCHGTVCVVGKMRDLILQLSKSSIYSTKPFIRYSYIAQPCCQSGLNILLVAAVSTRALISGGLSHHPGA